MPACATLSRPGFKDPDKRSEVLADMYEPSLTQLINDHQAGALANKLHDILCETQLAMQRIDAGRWPVCAR